MTKKLSEQTKQIVDGCAFAVLATLNADGTPHTSAIWVARDGDMLIFTTHDQRRKAHNLRRDGRAALTIFDPRDPYESVDVRGTVELVDDPDRSLSIELTHRYLGQEPPADPAGSRRLIGRMTAEHITGTAA